MFCIFISRNLILELIVYCSYCDLWYNNFHVFTINNLNLHYTAAPYSMDIIYFNKSIYEFKLNKKEVVILQIYFWKTYIFSKWHVSLYQNWMFLKCARIFVVTLFLIYLLSFFVSTWNVQPTLIRELFTRDEEYIPKNWKTRICVSADNPRSPLVRISLRLCIIYKIRIYFSRAIKINTAEIFHT